MRVGSSRESSKNGERANEPIDAGKERPSCLSLRADSRLFRLFRDSRCPFAKSPYSFTQRTFLKSDSRHRHFNRE